MKGREWGQKGRPDLEVARATPELADVGVAHQTQRVRSAPPEYLCRLREARVDSGDGSYMKQRGKREGIGAAEGRARARSSHHSAGTSADQTYSAQ